jgi:hypothetical protein
LVPPPGDIVKLVKDEATAVVEKVTTAAGVAPKAPTSSPNREPAVQHPALRLPSRTAHAVHSAVAAAHTSWSLPANVDLTDMVPALPTALAGPAARTPVIATGAAVVGAAPQNGSAAKSAADIAERGNGIMRAVLIALAAASAGSLGVAHVAAVRAAGR